MLCARLIYSTINRQLTTAVGTSSHTSSTTSHMSWSLEAVLALVAIILTLFLSGLGLVLQYRTRLSMFRSDGDLHWQLLAEGVNPLF